MQSVSPDNLKQLVTSALERMAFVFTDASQSSVAEVLARAAAHASIELRGKTSYIVTVSATAGLVQEVVSGMLGCEADDVVVDDHSRAAVAELANVFGGELVMKLGMHEDGLLIGLPRDARVEDARRLAELVRDSGMSCVVGSDSGQLCVTVVVD